MAALSTRILLSSSLTARAIPGMLICCVVWKLCGSCGTRSESLPEGAIAAAYLCAGGRRHIFMFRKHRYWELVGCTTKAASESQFETGTGWWRYMKYHPKCVDEREHRRRARYYWDSGVGIMYWKRRYHGQVIDIPEKLVAEGHCTSINKKNYRLANPCRRAHSWGRNRP